MGADWDEAQHPRESNGRFASQEVHSLRREMDLIWEAHSREHVQHELSHAREHAFAEAALEKAATLAKENKADANEWRASMTDREARFTTKPEHDAVVHRLDQIEDSLLVSTERERIRLMTEAETKRQDERRQQRDQWVVGVVIGIIVLVVNILIRFALP